MTVLDQGRDASAAALTDRRDVRWAAALLIGVLLFLRKPWALQTPQLWAEDGSIFLTFSDLHGLHAFIEPYMGYLHLIPRIIAWLASYLLDPRWWPAFYNGSALLIPVAVAARMFSPRFALPGKLWLALAFVLGPQTGEILLTITNIQWFTGVMFIQQTIINPPTRPRDAITDILLVAVCGLTGPFVIAFWPLLAWRWLRSRRGFDLAVLAVATACAFTQGLFVWKTGPHFVFPPFNLAGFCAVVGQHLMAWPLLGDKLARHLRPVLVGTIGLVAAGSLLVAAFRPHPLRHARLVCVAAFFAMMLATVYRSRPDTWNIENLIYGERYFFIPRLMLFWLLILEFSAGRAPLRWLARSAALLIAVVHLRHYMIPTPPDYHWAEHCDPIRRGVPANIPTLPEGWTLEYRGRPQPGTANR